MPSIDIGQMEKERNIKGLITALMDNDWMVRKHAAEALGRIHDTQAVKSLIAALRDKERFVQEAVIEALAKIPDVRAIDAIASVLTSSVEEWQLRVLAAKELGKNGGGRSVKPLAIAMQSSDSYVALDSYEALSHIRNPQAVDALISELQNRNSYVRQAAIKALGNIGDSRAAHSLIPYLLLDISDLTATEAENLGYEAAIALGKMGAIDPLIAALRDKRLRVQVCAAVSLGFIGEDSKELSSSDAQRVMQELAHLTFEKAEEALKIYRTRFGEYEKREEIAQHSQGPKEGISKALNNLNSAYLVRQNPQLEKEVRDTLDSILSTGEEGVQILLDRLYDGVTITNGYCHLRNWGDMAWNEFLKKREIIRCFERGHAESIRGRLQEMLDAGCSDKQWSEIVVPALRSALETIGSSGDAEQPAQSQRKIAETNKKWWEFWK